MKPGGVTSEEVLNHLGRRLPQFAASGIPEALHGGYLNWVWRVPGRSQSVIVKVAPPYIASRPEIPLNQARLCIEARCLATLGSGGRLAAVSSATVRPPRLLDYDEDQHILVMEDIGPCPDLGAWLWSHFREERSSEWVGQKLGHFIGALHAGSYGDTWHARFLDNKAIQRTRLDVQYRAIGELCERASLPDAGDLGRRALRLGELLQKPGLCVIMGDLWPPSVLVTPSGLRVIDWELAHFGRPSQDVGHLAAHLWMHAHRAPTHAGGARADSALQGFLRGYRLALGATFSRLFGSGGGRESAVHFGCEVLVRALGSFREGYVYDGLGLDDPQMQEAVAAAARHLRAPDRVDTFAALKP